MRPAKLCEVEGCNNFHLARGLCQKHYLRWYKYGSTSVALRDRSHEFTAYEKIMRQCNTSDSEGCWTYSGALTSKGYVHVRSDDGPMKFGHVIVYEHKYGKMPEGTEIDHTCNNRACMNPLHLDAVTHEENNHRAVERRKAENRKISLGGSEEERTLRAKNAAVARWHGNQE